MSTQSIIYLHTHTHTPWQLVLSAGSSIWSSAQAHCRPSGMARHKLLQPPLLTRHVLEPVDGRANQKCSWPVVFITVQWTSGHVTRGWEKFLLTLLLLSVVHSYFKDGWSLVAQQSGDAGGGVQLVNAATAVLVPEQEVFIMAQAKGVVQFLTLVHRLVRKKYQRQQQKCDELYFPISAATLNPVVKT